MKLSEQNVVPALCCCCAPPSARLTAPPHPWPPPSPTTHLPRRTDSPAEMMLMVTNQLLEGVMPDVKNVMVVRQAIREDYDLYQPLGLRKQIQGANMDVSVLLPSRVARGAGAHAETPAAVRLVCAAASCMSQMCGAGASKSAVVLLHCRRTWPAPWPASWARPTQQRGRPCVAAHAR
jgi:hypothetical protein